MESLMHGLQLFLEILNHRTFYFDGVFVLDNLILDFGHLVLGVFLMNFKSFDNPISGMDIADKILNLSIQLRSLLMVVVGLRLELLEVELQVFLVPFEMRDLPPELDFRIFQLADDLLLGLVVRPQRRDLRLQ